jgi:hypothetical protein
MGFLLYKRFAAHLAVTVTVASSLVFGGGSVANATGMTRIQHPDGDITTYDHVRFTFVHHSLRLTSADGKGVLAIALTSCVKDGEIHVCRPGGVTYRQNGDVRAVDLTDGTLYFNPTAEKRALPLSSTQVPAYGVILTLHTAHDTYLSATAAIDGLKK